MKLFVVLAVLCASTLADDKDAIKNDLDGAISSINNAITTATNMVSHTVTMKLNLKRSCWKNLTNNLTANSQEVKNMNNLTSSLTQLLAEIGGASDITPYEKIVLTGQNTPITQIVNAGAQLANALMDVISKLNVDTKC